MSTGVDNPPLRVPIQVHRPLPPDADVCYVELTRRRVGLDFEAAVCVTVRVPDPAPVEGKPPVALHMGWRSRADGSVRVGTYATSGDETLQVPDSLRDYVVSHGLWGEIIVPASMAEIAGRPAEVKSQRDKNFDRMREEFATWLESHRDIWDGDDATEPKLIPHHVRKWKAQGRLAAVTLRWRNNPDTPSGWKPMVERLEAWRKQDKHLLTWEAHERDQTTHRRDDVWRNVAAWLTGLAGVLVVDDTNLAELRKRKDITETDLALPGPVEDKARARSAIVAPGLLRSTAVIAAARRGVEVRQVSAEGLSRQHAVCGHVERDTAKVASSAVLTCRGCGQSFDQDHNAVSTMLTRERSGDTVIEA